MTRRRNMERAYNIRFKPHRRTSLYVRHIAPCVVYAKNKESAKELGQAIVKEITKSEYMTKQYTYVITRE